MTRIGCRHSLEGQRLSSLFISQQVATKGIITPTQMACQALGENSHSFDFFEKNKSTFPLVVDAYSRWLEMIPMTSTISLKTTEVLPSLFARYGLPEEVVSDDGPQLASEEFAKFMKQNGIKFTCEPP